MYIKKYLESQDYLVENYFADPIVDIKPGATCKAPLKTVVLGKWPGTVEGCYCKSKDPIDYAHQNDLGKNYFRERLGKNFYRAKCDSDKMKFTCTPRVDIPAEDEKHLYQWYRTRFCVQRETNWTYVKKGKCPDGFISCGNQYCMPSNKCPIT